MKPFRFLAVTTAVSLVLFLVSCGSGGDKSKTSDQDTSQTKMSETTTDKTPETPAAPKIAGIVVVRHKVANYAKWKMGYDSHDSARTAAGLSNYLIARGLGKDSNMVAIVLKAQDMVRAKEFASSTDLKETMQKAGVIGMPTIDYDEFIWNDDSKIDQNMRLLVSHKVKSYAAWKQAFDGDKAAREAVGLVDRGIVHASGYANDVSVVFAVNDLAKAKAFIASKELKDKMTDAGVEGVPTFFFYTIVQSY